jgi:hypothetical protein
MGTRKAIAGSTTIAARSGLDKDTLKQTFKDAIWELITEEIADRLFRIVGKALCQSVARSPGLEIILRVAPRKGRNQ